MSEYSKEKLWFLKLPKDFFTGYQMRVLEGMPNGKEYELMYLKLMCESISHGGYLRYSEEIVYTPEMIAGITNTNIDLVRVGLTVLKSLGLAVETIDGSILLPEVGKMTASITKGAYDKALSRSNGGQTVDKCLPNVHQDT